MRVWERGSRVCRVLGFCITGFRVNDSGGRDPSRVPAFLRSEVTCMMGSCLK